MGEPLDAPRKRYTNKATRRNQTIFGVSLIFVQAGISVAYGMAGNVDSQTINVGSVITVVFLALLAVVGFALHFSFTRHMAWGGLGFSFLLTCLALQIYPLFNALWGKVGLHQTSDSFTNNRFNLSLASMDSPYYQNNTITAAFKCALALIVSMGSLLGRIGPLECLILGVLGAAGYEVNRSIVGRIGQDLFGSFSIFTFGGFMGLLCGICLRLRENKKRGRDFNFRCM